MTAPEQPQEAAAPKAAQIIFDVASNHVMVPCSDSREGARWRRWEQCSGCDWQCPAVGVHPVHVAAEQHAALDAAGLLRAEPDGTETEVEWRVVGGWVTTMYTERKARDWAASIPGWRVQSRTVTRTPWADA